MTEIKVLIDKYTVKRDQEIVEAKECTDEMMAIRNSVKDSKEIKVPQYIVEDEIVTAANELKAYFGTMPEKAILCCSTVARYLLKLVKLEKVVIITTELEPNQKLPFFYLAEFKGQKVVIVDTLQANEDKYPEFYPVLPTRVLILSGVSQFFVITEAFAADPSFHPGKAFLFENYMPMNIINPFIGKHTKEWGDRFLDVTQIFDPKRNTAVVDGMKELIPLTTENVIWTNPKKTYGDRAELLMAQSLRIPIFVSRGMSQALVLHDMKKDFVVLGLIQRNLNHETTLSNEQRKELVEKLINVFSVNIKFSK